jgi:hypothetical protein
LDRDGLSGAESVLRFFGQFVEIHNVSAFLSIKCSVPP